MGAFDGFMPRSAGRQGAIIIAVAALHVGAISALLLFRVESKRIAEHRTEMTFVQLPPIVPPKQRPKRRAQRPPGAITLPDYHWVLPLPGINTGPNAITVPPIGKLSFPKASAELLRGSCPKVLKPDSPIWKRCMAPPKPLAPTKPDDWQEFEVSPIESLYAERWKAEKRARQTPYKAPCTYTSSAGGGGGGAAMVDLGCAAKSLFGHD